MFPNVKWATASVIRGLPSSSRLAGLCPSMLIFHHMLVSGTPLSKLARCPPSISCHLPRFGGQSALTVTALALCASNGSRSPAAGPLAFPPWHRRRPVITDGLRSPPAVSNLSKIVSHPRLYKPWRCALPPASTETLAAPCQQTMKGTALAPAERNRESRCNRFGWVA